MPGDSEASSLPRDADSVMGENRDGRVEVGSRDDLSRQLEDGALFQSGQREQQRGGELRTLRGVERDLPSVQGTPHFDGKPSSPYMSTGRPESSQCAEELVNGAHGKPSLAGDHRGSVLEARESGNKPEGRSRLVALDPDRILSGSPERRGQVPNVALPANRSPQLVERASRRSRVVRIERSHNSEGTVGQVPHDQRPVRVALRRGGSHTAVDRPGANPGRAHVPSPPMAEIRVNGTMIFFAASDGKTRTRSGSRLAGAMAASVGPRPLTPLAIAPCLRSRSRISP